jgi:carbonic anhydrase
MNKVTAKEGLNRLVDGNRRYVSNLISLKSISHGEKRPTLVAAQNPFAIVLSCSDSRVPSEIVFDQGLGDLFVIRVAGNIVAPSIIGSIEFAASTFGTQLVVVMGHSKCGAVSAALDCQLKGHEVPSENIRDIVDRITPSIKPVLDKIKAPKLVNRDELLDLCIHSNTEASIQHVKSGSQIIRNLILENKLEIVGAEYCLTTGKVIFFKPNSDSEISETLIDDNRRHRHETIMQEPINVI